MGPVTAWISTPPMAGPAIEAAELVVASLLLASRYCSRETSRTKKEG